MPSALTSTIIAFATMHLNNACFQVTMTEHALWIPLIRNLSFLNKHICCHKPLMEWSVCLESSFCSIFCIILHPCNALSCGLLMISIIHTFIMICYHFLCWLTVNTYCELKFFCRYANICTLNFKHFNDYFIREFENITHHTFGKFAAYLEYFTRNMIYQIACRNEALTTLEGWLLA